MVGQDSAAATEVAAMVPATKSANRRRMEQGVLLPATARRKRAHLHPLVTLSSAVAVVEPRPVRVLMDLALRRGPV